ncbi:hypothetical protein BGZ99_007687 [Dissophora globulifera]|uniref:Calponin-homology (CH) domain-containing protein n=1 Tax=Dissophora globulifera TaxID=979702 RepID=A0A9P6R8T1_9FUNG|nr:hypothetical protein BGZ99_007687 [Dissophora globulifera]
MASTRPLNSSNIRGASQHNKDLAGSIPNSFPSKAQSFINDSQHGNSNTKVITNENIFKKPLLGVPSVSTVKRKLSKTELGPTNKIHLRRLSNSFSDTQNNNNTNSSTRNTTHGQLGTTGTTKVTPLSAKTQATVDHDTNTADVPALVLAPFEPSPWLEFGKVIVGTKKTLAMVVQNPTNVVERLILDPNCKMEEKGFNISQFDPLHTGVKNSTIEPLMLPPRSKIELDICWTPLTIGSTRVSAILKTNTGRFMVNLRGCGEIPQPEHQNPNGSRRPSTTSARNAVSNPKSSVLKQSVMRSSGMRPDLTNSAPAPTGYSTLPYVITNDMYDEKWIDKQERSFSQWLNHEFNVTVDAFSAKDPSSWSYYSHKLEFEHTRAAACKIYQSDTFRIVLRKVEESIGRDRLQLRPDCNLFGDVGTRREIIDMFFSFDIRWLVLGLETITGKATAINPNFDRAAIFHDKQIEAEFEPDRVLSNRPKFYQAMNRLILKRIFMLILFLDKAKIARLIPSDPCLFNKGSDIKSCRALLLTISKNNLLGEGDIIRHLLFMGYSVLHVQAPLDEFDYTVKNLAVDLRDGVRLCRLIDLHCPELNLCLKMKFPTLSKAHMQQNVSLALNALVKQGFSLEGIRGGVVTPRDIVEGHREKTFGLLWKLILNWKVSVLLDLAVLEAEIDAIKTEYKKMFAVEQPDRVDTVYFTSNQLSALLRWCQAIGSFYNLSISNFTTSFSDGRAFGALLSYYHPTLLDMNDMKDSAQFLTEYKQGLHHPEPNLPDGSNGKSFFIDTKDIKDPVTRAKEMDRFNYRLLHNKVQALGGVPITLRHADMSNVGVPDEKAVILFVTYLCARLMHLNKDIRAAKTIQRIWRKKHYGRREESRTNATVVIQKHIRGFLSRKHAFSLKNRQEEAATLIQTGCRMYLAQMRIIHKIEGAIRIQTQCRAFLARKRFNEHQQHRARIIQAQARGYLARKRFLLLRIAAEVIQSRRRATLEIRRVQGVYRQILAASIVIQRRWRAVVARRKAQQEYQMVRGTVIGIQSIVRGALARQSYFELRVAALIVQRRRRAFVEARTQENRFLRLRFAARVVHDRRKALLLGRATREYYQEVRSSIVMVQAAVRGYLLRERLFKVLRENQASVVIQAAWRGYVHRQAFLQIRTAAIIIQRARRAVVQVRAEQHAFKEYQWSAAVIQQWWRACRTGQEVRAKYQRLRRTCVAVQSLIRGQAVRREVQGHRAIVGIQAIVRMRLARWEFEMQRAAAVIIQQRWRARQAGIYHRALYESKVHAAITIQRNRRAIVAIRKAQAEYKAIRVSIIATQTQTRGALVRKQYQDLRWAAVVIQRQWRARAEIQAQRYDFLQRWTAATTIQRAWRSARLTQIQRHKFLDLRWATIVTQQRWRQIVYLRVMREQEAMERHAAATMIQAAARGCLVRNRIRQHLEDRERVMMQWMELSSLSFSAIVIQRFWRRYQERQFLAMNEAAAVKLQRWWRRMSSERQEQHLEQLTLMVQTQARGLLARQRFERKQQAILKVQSWWRGHVVRQDCTAKIKEARKRIEHANATAEEHMKLGNRTTMALDILLSSGQLSAVLKACYHLDVVTRLSKNSCLRLVEHNVINIIFQLIKSCNRSQPHMEVLKHGLNIIENLSRDNDTVGSVFWAPGGMEILVDCSQAYRENEMVFESVVTILLIHLELDAERRKVVKAMAPEVKKLRGVLAVMERRVEREARNKSAAYTPTAAGGAGKSSYRMLVQSVGKLRRIVELLQ